MERSFVAYLWDIQERGARVLRYVGSSSEQEYLSNSMLQDAAERNLEIIGEMVVQARRHFPEEMTQIRDYARIISFRNELAHGYDNLDQGIVWQVIRTSLPGLLAQVASMLGGAPPKA